MKTKSKYRRDRNGTGKPKPLSQHLGIQHSFFGEIMRSQTEDSAGLSKKPRLDAGIGTNEDRISNLPDEIISDILSCLPTKCAVQTSVLAKRWKHKWTSIYNIDIDDGFPFPKKASEQVGTFEHFVKSVFRQSHKIQSFSLSRLNVCGRHFLRELISAALESKVETIHIYAPDTIVLPGSSFTSLTRLVMNMVCNLRFFPGGTSCFPNLTHLYLKEVEFENKNSDTLTLKFPVLQVIDFTECRWSVLKFVEIYAPKLTMFRSMTRYEFVVGGYSIKIDGARIANFEICGVIPETFLLAGSEVSYADLGNVSGSTEVIQNGLQVRKLLKELSCIQSLKLSSFLLQGMAQTKSRIPLPRFYKLRKLVLSSASCDMWDDLDPPGNIVALLELLHATPVLKFLDIDVVSWDDYDIDDNTMLQLVPSCIVSHLEEVRLTNLKWSPEEALQPGYVQPHLLLAWYLLKEGAQLKKFSICCEGEYGGKRIKKFVSIFPKASSCLKLEVSYKR